MRSLLCLITLSLTAFAGPTTAQPGPAKLRVPVEFEANVGQFASEAHFFASGPHFRAFFTAAGPVFIYEKTTDEKSRTSPDNRPLRRVRGVVLRMRFAGMDTVPQAAGKLPGVGNYFIGNDPSQWHVGVPHYRRIVYKNAYPGIDIVFYSGRSPLEYDVIAAPGADVSQVRMQFEGAGMVRVDRTGALMIETPAGVLRQSVANVYEEIHGRTHRLSSRFAVHADGRVRLVVPRRDLNARLVVDPVLEYSTLLGGTDLDNAGAIAIDGSGHAYVAGTTNSTDFPTTAGAFDRVCDSSINCGKAFVTKLNATGTGLLYSTLLGGTGGDGAAGIAVDSSGNAYVTGTTRSNDFPGTFLSSSRGVNNVFVTKVNASGSGLVYSVLFGGSVTNQGSAIALDGSRNAYVAGSSQSNDFPTTPGAFQTSAASDFHPFLVKLNAAGTAFVYATRLGGTTSTDFSHSVAVDSSGNAYLAGEAGSNDFPTTSASIAPTKAPDTRAGFLAKFNPTGSDLIYSTFWGDVIFGVTTDSGHNAYVTGGARTLPTTSGALQNAQKGNGDAFVSKISPTGQGLVYSTFLGGSGFDFGSGIAVNGGGEAYILGSTNSSDLPVTVTAFEEVFPGGGCGDPPTVPCQHAFVAKLNATATALSYSSYLGGNGEEFVDNNSVAGGSPIALDGNGSIYVTSGTASLNFPTTNTAFRQKLNDSEDAFVAKITPLCGLKSAVPSVTVCTPGSGSTVHSPVTIIAGTRDSRKVKLLQVYVDGAKKYEAALSAVEVKLAIPAGTHRVTVQAIDTANAVFKTPVTITVAP